MRVANASDPIARPRFELTTTEAYDVAALSRYAGNYDAIYAHIDDNLDAHLAAIQRWLRQPSISAQNIGITEMAELLRAGLGFGTGAHAPNEIMLIYPADGVDAAGLAEIEKGYVDFVFALAGK